jgi:hypothetical protein
MVRHSTFQVYSDVNTKTISGYQDPSSSSTNSSANESSVVKGSSKVVTERVENVMGSCAGAGSSEFHLYLNARKRETARLENISVNQKLVDEHKLRELKLEQNKLADEDRERKNADKRKKKKDKKLKKRKFSKSSNGGKVSVSDEGENSDENDSDIETNPNEKETPSPTDQLVCGVEEEHILDRNDK